MGKGLLVRYVYVLGDTEMVFVEMCEVWEFSRAGKGSCWMGVSSVVIAWLETLWVVWDLLGRVAWTEEGGLNGFECGLLSSRAWSGMRNRGLCVKMKKLWVGEEFGEDCEGGVTKRKRRRGEEGEKEIGKRRKLKRRRWGKKKSTHTIQSFSSK